MRKRMFMGAQGVGPLGVMEADALIIQAEQKLINQADELVVLVDSTKFARARASSSVRCSASPPSSPTTASRIGPEDAGDAGVKLIVAKRSQRTIEEFRFRRVT